MGFAKEGGHWYKRSGAPCYTVIGNNGKTRNTTLRDARKLDLLPSVTTIMKECHKPGLEIWKMNQVLMSALTLTRFNGESDEAFKNRIRRDSGEHAKEAAKRGTEIHGWIEQGLSSTTIGFVPEDGLQFVELAKVELERECGDVEWEHERSFAADRFAGKVDLHGTQAEKRYIIDIKTNEKPVADAKLYDEHLMQLAAYSVGLFDGDLVRGGILFINHKGIEAKVVWATKEEMEKGWKMFEALVNYWYAKKGLQLYTKESGNVSKENC